MQTAVLDALRQLIPADNLHTDPASCWSYGYDNSREHCLPAVVVLAEISITFALLCVYANNTISH